MALLFIVHCVHADVVLVPGAVSVPGGGIVSLRVMVTNPGTGLLVWPVKKSLAGRLHSGSSRSEDVLLTTNAPEGALTVQPGGYVQLAYQFPLPAGMAGPVVLELTQLGAQPVMFSVLERDDAARASEAVAQNSRTNPEQIAHETALRRGTRLLPGLSRYEPNYFAMGGSGGLNSKFQLSLKFQPSDLVPFYFSYSQTTLWDLHKNSYPFHDTSYRPRIFFQKDLLWVSKDNKVWFGLESGLGHESNGQAGVQSRSMEVYYARPRLDWAAPGDFLFFVSPMVYGYFDKAQNPDIADYRGHADLQIGVTKNGWRLNTTLRKGDKARYGSVEVNAILPLRSSDRLFDELGARGMNGYWFVQYFDGWGETILDYNRKLKAQFRTGLMIVP